METTWAIDPGSAFLSQFPLIDSTLMRSPVKGEINRPSTSTSTEPSPSRVGTTLIDKGSTVVAGSVNQPCNRLLGLGHSLAIKPMPKRDPPRSINLRASFEMVSMRRQFHHFTDIVRYRHLALNAQPLNRFADRQRAIYPSPTKSGSTKWST